MEYRVTWSLDPALWVNVEAESLEAAVALADEGAGVMGVFFPWEDHSVEQWEAHEATEAEVAERTELELDTLTAAQVAEARASYIEPEAIGLDELLGLDDSAEVAEALGS